METKGKLLLIESLFLFSDCRSVANYGIISSTNFFITYYKFLCNTLQDNN